MNRSVVVLKRILASASGVLLSAYAASAADGVRLVAQPDLMPRVAAFPRVAPGEPQAARINQALAAADARAMTAAEECRSEFSSGATAGLPAGRSLDPGRILGWKRRIVVAMRGPRYLALVTADYADCGGLYPNTDSIALTYDLRTGQPPNWSVLLPKLWVQTMTIDRAMDETPRGMVGSPALRSLYLATAGKAIRAISPDCMESMNQMAGPFMLWPDAQQGGLMVQPTGLPHAFAACGVPALIGIDRLRRQGVQPALLDAIATAHRAAMARPVSGTRRVFVGRAALGLLSPAGWSFAATAQDLATMPLDTLVAQAANLSPDSLYMLAGRLFAAGRRDEAVVWFYIAQLRVRFRLAVAFDLKPDGEPAVYGALFETIGLQINNWAFGDIDSLAAHMQEALDWDSSHANAFTPKAGHAAELEEVRSGLAAFRANVLARKGELRRDRAARHLENR